MPGLPSVPWGTRTKGNPTFKGNSLRAGTLWHSLALTKAEAALVFLVVSSTVERGRMPRNENCSSGFRQWKLQDYWERVCGEDEHYWGYRVGFNIMRIHVLGPSRTPQLQKLRGY